MKKKLNIWYFHPYACTPSSGKKKPNRSYYLSVEWARLGHRVSVITSSYEHIGGKKSEIHENYCIEKIDDVDFVWLFTPDYDENNWRRIFNMWFYARQIKKYKNCLLGELGVPDVIICSVQHPFHFNICKKIAQSNNALLITEVRDLWPLSLVQLLGVNKFHPFCIWLSIIEKTICKKSAYLVSLLGNSKEYFISKGLMENKFFCISNGYVESLDFYNDDYKNDIDYQELFRLKNEGKFVIGYTGAHGQPNHLKIICEAVARLIKIDVVLFLIGDGNLKPVLVEQYSKYKNIFFVDPKNKSVMRMFQRKFDVAYMGLHHVDIYKYGISFNKMYEYMYNEVPVLTGIFPKTPVSESRGGVFFENESLDSLIQAIKFSRELPKDELVAIGKRGRNSIIDCYLYPKLAERYLEVMMKPRCDAI